MDRRSFLRSSTAVASGAAVVSALPMVAVAGESVAPATEVPAWLGEEPQIAEADIVEVKETTLLIIGAGTSGLCCAATAADMGIDFFLAEKIIMIPESREYVGAVNTKQVVEAGLTANKGMLLNELSRYASGKCDRDVIKMWIDESAELVEWYEPMFAAVGQTVMLPDYGEIEEGGTLYYSPVTEHMSATAYIPPTKNDVLLAHIEASGNKVNYSYEMVKLVHGEEGVTGAIFDTDDGYVQVNAKYTVLACGGYAANPQMMMALAPEAVACSVASSYNPSCRGDGIKAGIWAGCVKEYDPTPMLFDRGAVEPGVDAGYEDLGGGKYALRGDTFQLNIGSQPFMKVNRRGKRFANESTTYDNMCFAAGRQPGGVFCMVFDGNGAADMIRFGQGGCAAASRCFVEKIDPSIDGYLEYVGATHVKKADTLDELADLLGFAGADKDAFLETCNRYNGFFDAGVDEDYGKEAYRLSELRTPPFYGCWFGSSLLTTLDGLRINANLEALDASGEPIAGLYAIGDCSGSFFNTNYPEYIVGVAAGRSSVQGRHLAKAVAAAEGIDVEAADAAAKAALAAAVTVEPEPADYTTALGIVCW